jgi:hypothetical protein
MAVPSGLNAASVIAASWSSITRRPVMPSDCFLYCARDTLVPCAVTTMSRFQISATRPRVTTSCLEGESGSSSSSSSSSSGR